MTEDLRADVLVVGAGPAGGMAAFDLARQAVDVLVVDRFPFPREKVCGDGLLESSIRILDAAGLGGVVRKRAHAVDRLRFFAPNGTECGIEGDFYTLKRSDFDALLLDAAQKRGARFISGVGIKGPVLKGETCQGAEGVDSRGKKVQISAPLVLLATGANTRLLGAFGVLRQRKHSAIGIRAYYHARESVDEKAVVISYHRRLLPGYGWIFPMGGGLFNVGCGIFLNHRTRRKSAVSLDLTSFHRHLQPLGPFLSRTERVSLIRAAPMRTGFRGAQAWAPGLLVLGEALGLTFPFLGEGVSCALESGQVAAAIAVEALGNGNFHSTYLSRYEGELRRRLEMRHRGYLAAERWFEFELIANLLIGKTARSAALRELVGQIMRGEREPGAVFSSRGIGRILLHPLLGI